MLLHLQGRIDRSTGRAWESFAVTEDDFIHYGDVARRLPVSLAARLRRTHLLLLGYTLSTWTLRVVLERFWGSDPLPYRSWSVHPGPQPLEREFWRRRDVEVVDMAPAAYVAELERALEKAVGLVTGAPESPYKGLASFEDSELDALLFFGREREIAAVAANVLANRLTVLYGPSGVGKSSLLGAGVARRLREQSGAPVVVQSAWAEDPAGRLIAAVHAECGELGATAGLVDTVAAAAQRSGELHLLLDNFEEYMLYHGVEGPLSAALPELLRRPGLRVNVLLALRDDALAELDEFAGRIPELFSNLLRLDRLDREAGKAAILGPLARYSELAGEEFTAEDALVEAVLDEASTDTGVEAPYLQLVLERLWEREREEGSHELRLATLRAIGGARAVVREHVRGALDALPLAEQDAAARVVRQLVTPSGRKVSHEPSDLAEYAHVDDAELRRLLERLGRERIVRGVNGMQGAPTRYEIFHDVLGPPILAWQAEHRLQRERIRAQQQHRRQRAIIGAILVALAIVAGIAVFALVQRSDARTQARHAHGAALAGRALADIPTNPQVSVNLALRAAQLSPGRQTADVLRSSLAAMRETAIVRLGGDDHRSGLRSLPRRAVARGEHQRSRRSVRPRRPQAGAAAAAAHADCSSLEP